MTATAGGRSWGSVFRARRVSASLPGVSLEEQIVADDYAYIVWNAVTTENEYEFASDTFVVEDGESVAQTLAAKVSPKR